MAKIAGFHTANSGSIPGMGKPQTIDFYAQKDLVSNQNGFLFDEIGTSCIRSENHNP